MTVEPAEYDQEDKLIVPIELWGKKWPVPELAPKQLKRCRANIIAITKYLNGEIDKVTPEETTGDRLVRMSDAQYADLCRIVQIGMSVLNPGVTAEWFDEQPIKDSEMYNAFLFVRHQSQLFRVLTPEEVEAAKAQEGQPKGEAAAPLAQ